MIGLLKWPGRLDSYWENKHEKQVPPSMNFDNKGFSFCSPLPWPLILEKHNEDGTMLWISLNIGKLWATKPRKGRFWIRTQLRGASNSACGSPVSSSSIVLYKIVNFSFNVLRDHCIPFYVLCSLWCNPWLTSPKKIKYFIDRQFFIFRKGSTNSYFTSQCNNKVWLLSGL